MSEEVDLFVIGDGSFLYNPVVQALGAAKGNDLPILIVVCNNGQYRAMQVGHRHHYPDGVAQEADMWHGVFLLGFVALLPMLIHRIPLRSHRPVPVPQKRRDRPCLR